MNIISLETVSVENVRSIYSQSAKLDLEPGLRLLTGENLVEPRLGANGAGKSSLFDAIFWCLYGTTVRGAKIGSIVSWGRTVAKVILELRVGDRKHRIVRSGPPNRIEIDGEAAGQEAIELLLGLGKKRFLNSIIFGQGLPLFPDLPGPERGEIFDEVLNLSIWQKASEQATLKHRTIENQLAEKKQDEHYLLGALATIESEERIRERIDNWERQHQAELDIFAERAAIWRDDHIARIEEARLNAKRAETDNEEQKNAWRQQGATKVEHIEKLAKELELVQRNHIDSRINNDLLRKEEFILKDLENCGRDLVKAKTLASREIENYKLSLASWQEYRCPACGQSVKDVASILRETKEKIAEREKVIKEADTLLSAYDAEIKSTKQEIDTIRAAQAVEQERANVAIREKLRLELEIDRLIKEIEQLITAINKPFVNLWEAKTKQIEAETNPHELSFNVENARQNPYRNALERAQEEREKLSKELLEVQVGIKVLEQKLISIEYWKLGFKRIRLFYVNQQLALYQAEVQNALSALGLDNWQVIFSTETETKSGTMKLGINIHIKSPKAEGPWEGWSGGESQRLRLAMAMGLSSLIQQAAGVVYTFEIWDEPTNWLSANGIEDLLEALRYRSEVNGKCIWIIDHRALQSSSFSEIWIMQKGEDGSKIRQVYESEA